MRSMKYLFFIVIVFLLALPVFPQTNSGLVTYHVQYVTSLSPQNSNAPDPYFEMTNEGLKELEYILKFNQKMGVFQLEESLEIDNRSNLKPAQITAGQGNYYHYNKGVLHQREFVGDMLLISYDIPLEWTITQESKKVGAFTCYKALATYNFDNGVIKKQNHVEAWFTNEIPVSYGPKHYFGLPGLILEVIDDSLRFYAVEIQLGGENVDIDLPDEGIKLTEIEFEQYVRKKVKERFGRN